MSSTAARLGSVAPSMRFEAIMEDNNTIRLTHNYKTDITMQHADMSPVMTDEILVSQASYTALEAVSGVLSGSI